MPAPTWDEYLAQATIHLTALRRAAELGLSLPVPPERPQGQMPEDRREVAERLSMGYDQLATEVTARLFVVGQRRSALPDRNPHRELRPAHFFNTPA